MPPKRYQIHIGYDSFYQGASRSQAEWEAAAKELLEDLAETTPDNETLGLLGRVYKDRWMRGNEEEGRLTHIPV